jgi:hypothetical protein
MITDSDKITLPIGLEIDGIRYREVIIDEMTGIDEENLASRKVRNNGAKAITMLLRRCIQSIEGVLERKSNPLSLIDEKWVRNMYVADRDYLVFCIRALSGNKEIITTSPCPSCEAESTHLVDISELDVYEWEDNAPAMIDIELVRGFFDERTQQYHKNLKWSFPKGDAQERLAVLPENQLGTSLIASGITEVEGLEYVPSSDAVRRLSLRDRNAIAEAIVDNAVGVDTQLSVSCDHCGEEHKIEVNTVGFSNSGQQKTQKDSKGGMSGRRLRKKR